MTWVVGFRTDGVYRGGSPSWVGWQRYRRCCYCGGVRTICTYCLGRRRLLPLCASSSTTPVVASFFREWVEGERCVFWLSGRTVQGLVLGVPDHGVHTYALRAKAGRHDTCRIDQPHERLPVGTLRTAILDGIAAAPAFA
jgi:hypothetical protein